MSPFGTPLPGPIDAAPQVGMVEAQEMLDRAVLDLPLGTYDRQILAWAVRALDQPTAAVLASLIARARAVGEAQSGRFGHQEPQAG